MGEVEFSIGNARTMVKSTQIARLDGLMPAASVDDEQVETELAEVKSQAKMIFRRLNRNSEQQASIESGQYTLHYIIKDSVCFLCICDRSYPRKLAFTYLSDLAQEFTTIYPSQQYLSATLRPYAFVEFDTYIQRTKKVYQDSRASANLDKLNDELKDVTKVMTKNIEDLLYRGDSLERMGEMSGRLREDSKKIPKSRSANKLGVDAETVRTFRRSWIDHDFFLVVALLLSDLLASLR